MPLRACGAAALLLAASPRARCRAGGSRAGAGGAGTARAAGEEPSCLSEGASTSALLRCIAWRQDAGHSGFEAHTPTEEAEDTAMRYMSNLGKDKGGPQAGPISKVHTQHSLEQFSDFMQTGRGLPRIFALDGGQWGRACDWSEESLGYRYSLENYMRTWILGNSGYLVEDMNVADFVYLPHCATGIFMHVVAKEQIERQGQKKRRPRPRPNGSTETTPASEAYLEYEGSLPLRSTRQVDGTYLMGALKSWARVPEFKTCMDRRSCRFLIVSVYGRHVWRNLAGAFGAKAVFLTHAGLSGWLSQQPDLFLAHASRRRGRQAGAEPACRAICPLHCQREPPPVLQDDVVLPWIVAFGWTRRSGQFSSRDIHVFYSGTQNSCAREKLHAMFRSRAEAELSGNVSGGAMGGRVLIFPPERRLMQEEWSELAFRSRLCLAPDGDSPNTGRLVEVIMHGCVPVIISERLQPPLHEHLDWSKIAFFVHEDDIAGLPRLLRWLATPEGVRELTDRQEALSYAAAVLDYNRPGLMSSLAMALRSRVLRFWEPGTRPEAE